MKTLCVNSQDMVIKDYQGKRVITFKDIDSAHERQEGTAKRNYLANKKHFIEGVDYLSMTRREFGTNFVPNKKVVGNPNLPTLLFTESGYLMLVKSFTDELAWKVQRQLVNTYFRHKDYLSNEFKIPTTLPDALRLAADLSEERDKLEKENQALLPQAKGYQLIVDGTGLQRTGMFAKSMNWGKNKLYAALREYGIFMPNTREPYGKYTPKYFQVKWTRKYGVDYPYTLITPKGMNYICKKVQQWGIIDELLDAGRREALACRK